MTLKNLLFKTKQPKPFKLAVGGILDETSIYETVQKNPSEPLMFCTYTKGSNGTHGILFEQEMNYIEPTLKPYTKLPWNLPNEPLKYGSTSELWEEIHQCLYDHIDLPDTEAYNILTAWIFASWLTEKWSISPYIFAHGSFSTGKTRILEVLAKLSFRGWLALYMSTASLYRPVESWKPTLFLDEAEVYTGKNEMLSLLNGSYRRGQYVARQKETDDGFETEFFDCFCFKGIAGTAALAKTLQSRCIILKTSQATRKIKFFVDEQRCNNLRNKLLRWRFDRMLEDFEHFEDNTERGKQLEQLVPIIGSQRETELYYPLIAVAPTDELKNRIIQYAKNSASSKLEELSLTTEATALTAILTAKSRGLVQNGKLLIADITSIVNETLGFDEQWKERSTSSHCSRLGFQKVRGSNGKACIMWSDQLVERLKHDNRYSLCFTTLLETPSNSSKSSNQQPKTDWLTQPQKEPTP